MPTTMRIMPTIPAGFTMRMLQRPPTANQLDNEHDQRDEEQQMNVSAENMEADKPRSQRISRITNIVQSIKNLSFVVVVNGSLQRSRSRLPKIARRIVRHGESVSPVGRIRPVADRWRNDFTIGRFS